MKKVFAVIITLTMLAGLLAVFAGAANASDALDYNDPSLKYIGYSFDRFYWNGEHVGARAKIDEYLGEDGKIDGEALNAQSCGYFGWVAFDQPVKSLGYILNDKVVLDPAFIDQNEAGIVDTIRSWGGDWATSYPQRFMITVPLEGLSGDVFVCAVAELEDGTIVKLNDNNPQYPDRITSFTVKFPGGSGTETPATVDHPVSEAAGGVGRWIKKDQGTDSVAVKFTTKGSFSSFKFNNQYWCSNPTSTGAAADWKIELFKFDTDIATTVSKAPVASKTIHSEADNNPALVFTFDTQIAGTYIIKVTLTNPEDSNEKGPSYLVLPQISNPDATKFTFVKADGSEADAFNFILTGEAVDGDFFVANPEEGAAPEEPEQPDNPGTADVAVIAIAAVACIALAGVVVAKKVK